MPDFAYIARNGAGQRLTGNISAATRREALAMLAGQALFPIEVKTASPVAETRRIRRVPAQLLATTYAQLADLLHSGVPLLRSLEVMQKQTSHAGLRCVLEEVHHHVEEGSTLSEAMGRFTHVFGEMPISMIRAGGEGGFLEEVLERVAQFTETQEDLKQRTWGALAYPIVLVVVLVSVVTVLMVFLVPKFDTLFEQLRERNEMPALTEFVLGISNAMRSYGVWIVAAVAIAGWLFRSRLKSERGRIWLDRIKLRLPLMGPILLQLAVARFCRVLGTLLHNGVTILRSLEISADATGNRILAVAIREATENISAGQPLAGPLGACGHFPVAVVEMIAVAEQANNLENVLLSIADSMERRIWRRLDLAVRLLEPFLLLILASVVLVIVASLLLPLLKMSSTV
jgi:general secretion pathway protein F/type IV pilus assembly protein PilC